MPSIETTAVIGFSCPALPNRQLSVVRLDGREALSRPYRYELVLQSDDELGLDPDEIETLLHSHVAIALDPDHAHLVHGILDDVETLSMSSPRPVRYRVTFVPRLASLTRNVGSWVFQDQSVPAIVTSILRDRWGLTDDDFEFRVSQPHPSREYVVQYQESDFDFVSRLLESEGIFYFFAQGAEREKIVFADVNQAFPTLDDPSTLVYDPRPAVADGAPRIQRIARRRARSTGSVVVREYNYRAPAIALSGEAPVDDAGEGRRALYGDHFKTPDEGKWVARLRAQEIACARETFTGEGNVRELRAGQVFALEGHVHPAFEKPYLVIEVEHHVLQAAPGEEQGGSNGYTNRFVAISPNVQFRPARITARPRIDGVMHARIDGDPQTGMAAPLDSQGRYKVLLPYDLGGSAGGRASRWMRMIQPMTGTQYGVHFPLHIGTEVMLVHLDGDPDRPVIAGSVPTFATSSPVTSDNATQSVIRTRAGIQIRFEDQG